MPHGSDWIPGGQDEFFDWSENYVSGIKEYATALNVATTVVTALDTAQTAYVEARTDLLAAGQSKANTAAKKTLFKIHRLYLRDWHNEHVRYNKAVTPQICARCGFPDKDTNPSPIVVGDRKVGFELFPEGAFLVGMKCWDLDSGEKKIEYGMSGVVALFAFSDQPLTTIAELTDSVLLTRVSHTFHCADTLRGKWINVSCCWQSETGQRGPESPIQSAIIP
jgi:hypothetical protein